MAELWNESQDLLQGNRLNLYLTSGRTVIGYSTDRLRNSGYKLKIFMSLGICNWW